jgi:hypothetical protein
MFTRLEVRAFAEEMERQLRANDSKGKTGWKDGSRDKLFTLLTLKVQELGRAMINAPAQTVAQLAADTGNYAMMIADVTAPLVSLQRPIIVCLCGSTRFWRTFQSASLDETMRGRIVLSIGAASGTDDEHFGNLPKAEYDAVKERLDQLHLRKIELADEILVLNVGGYIGESTTREIHHAIALGKRVRWLEPTNIPAPFTAYLYAETQPA